MLAAERCGAFLLRLFRDRTTKNSPWSARGKITQLTFAALLLQSRWRRSRQCCVVFREMKTRANVGATCHRNCHGRRHGGVQPQKSVDLYRGPLGHT
nr:hypothetical protein CFP56_28833 [Quercus suber]